MANSKSVANWPNPIGPAEGLLLFAERWDEALFHYSLDSYRFRVFNTPALCAELVSATQLAEMGILSWASLPSIRDELLTHLDRDEAAKKLLGTLWNGIRSALAKWQHTSTDKNSAAFSASAAAKRLENTYLPELISRIMIVIGDPKRKEAILDGAGAIVTELIRKGYSPYFLYKEGQSFFFAENKIKAATDLETFLRSFDCQDKPYQVVFPMGTRSALLATRANSKFISHKRTLSPVITGNTEEDLFFKSLKNGTEFLTFQNVEAPDPNSARARAEERLATAASLVGFLVHKMKVDPPEVALIYQGHPPASAVRVRTEVRATLKRPDVHERFLNRSVDEILSILLEESVSTASKTRLEGALRAHISGIQATTPQNQFSNLWTALETMAGSTSERNTMETVMKCATPILCRKYLLKIVRGLERDLSRQIGTTYSVVLSSKNEKESKVEFLTRVLVSDDQKSQRENMYAACGSSPLLKNRIFRLHELLSDPIEAKKRIEEHEQRIRWHLQRIYRNRNALIHGGVSGKHLALLVPNLHDYVDHIFMEIVDRLASESDHPSFEKVFFEYELEYVAYKNKLEKLSGATAMSKSVIAASMVFDE